MIKIYGIEVKPTIFPDKTSQVWKIPEELFNKKIIYLKWNFEEERELIDLASIRALFDVPPELYIPYLPYARQDKEVSNTSTFNLRTFAHILNSLEFYKVIAFDVHNPKVTEELICRFENILPEAQLIQVHLEVQPDYIIFPDEGAKKRYPFIEAENFFFHKKRDALSGQIVDIYTEEPLDHTKNNKKFLIVDDICDGGRTFIEIAKKLKEKIENPEIYLYVSHGIFSQGKQILYDAGIKKIFTTKSLIKNTEGFSV